MGILSNHVHIVLHTAPPTVAAVSSGTIFITVMRVGITVMRVGITVMRVGITVMRVGITVMIMYPPTPSSSLYHWHY